MPNKLLRSPYVDSIDQEANNYLQNRAHRRAIRFKKVCEITGLGKSTIYSLIATGKFPAGFNLTPSGRAKGWFEDVIDDYLAAQAKTGAI